MIPEIRLLAAKTSRENDNLWLPLLDHLKDTAGVIEYLSSRWLRKERTSASGCLQDGFSGGSRKRKDGSRDRKTSGRIKGYGMLPGRNHHRLAALEESGFRGAIIKACDANFEKNKKLKG